MITRMSRVRVLGPRELLVPVLQAVQDLGVLHLSAPPMEQPLAPAALTPPLERLRRHLRRILEDVEAALEGLEIAGREGTERTRADTGDFARWARLARRVRREADGLAARRTELDEERALILKYQHFFSAFRSLLDVAARWPNATAYHVLVKGSEADVVPRLRASLTAAIGEEFELYTQRIPSGETALLVLVSSRATPKVEHLLAQARVQEIPIPAAYGPSLAAAIPQMLTRLGEIPGELADLARRREELARQHGTDLAHARIAIRDRLGELGAIPLSCVSRRAFVIEGWLPASARAAFTRGLLDRFDERVLVTEVGQEAWEAEEAPVVLHNPRLFRPFEALIRLFPLPHYGTIDPTPFVAVFFPAFFGMMLGDVGYGLILGVGALVLRLRTKPQTLLRAVAEIAGACAVFTVIAGLLFGEFFGDLGRRFGVHPLAFDREEALVPFLMLSVALGAVHIVLGLVLGVVAARHHPRQALGRGVSALMIVMIAVALLAITDVLPGGFFTPAVIGILVAFPVLIIAEGIVAPLELLSTLGNILSYARIMALGVASVMLAVVANRMVGAIGSVAVGVMFALLFHLVNFAIGLFSPTIHALRLHYVEFFGKFYSPGGVQYQPFRHWSRTAVGSEE